MVRAPILASLLSSVLLSQAFAADNEIVIGMLPPLTGAHIQDAQAQQKAMAVALSRINSAGGINGKKLRVVMEDNNSTETGALDAFKRLVEKEKPAAIFLPSKTFQVIALNDLILKKGVPVFTGATAAKVTKQGNQWLFRCRPDDTISAWAMVKYIKEETKHTKIGILHDTDAFGIGGADLVEKYAKELGLTVAKRAGYLSRERDFLPKFREIKEAGSQVMIVYGPNSSDVGIIQRQFKDFGSPMMYMGSPASQYRGTLKISQAAADGIYAVSDVVTPGDAMTKYAAEYKKVHNEEVDPAGLWVFDCMTILGDALKKSGDAPVKLRESLLATKNHMGTLGSFTFSPTGDGLHEVSIVKIEGGEGKVQKVVREK